MARYIFIGTCSMDRRAFLKTTGSAAAAATTATAATAETVKQLTPSAAPAVAKGTRELRLAMPWPDSVAGFGDQARRLARRVEAMSEGRYRFAIMHGVGRGLSAVQQGEADLYHGTEHDHLNAHRALAFFAGLPGERGIAPQHLLSWLLLGGGQTLWDDLAGDFGVKGMLAGHTGGQAHFLATRRVDTMSALAGEKVSIMGLARDVVHGFGLEPVTVGATDVASALSRGEILAAEWGGAIASHSLGLTAAAPYAVGTSVNRHGTALSLGIRRSLWDGLSAADQAIFTAAAAAELQLALAEEETHRMLLHPDAPAHKTWPLAPDLERAIGRVSDAVVAHVAGSDAQAQRINASYVTFRRLALGDDAPAGGPATV
ncbi:MAG: twin-arginine translocation signal domain-containing protein [Hyphomicrobium sp.]